MSEESNFSAQTPDENRTVSSEGQKDPETQPATHLPKGRRDKFVMDCY